MSEGIIIVERSATLSHLVQRTLGATGITAQASLSNYGEAVAHIDSHEVAAVILGSPQRNSPEFEALLSFLKTGAGKNIPVLLMANEKTPQLTQWLSDRRLAQTLLWANFGRIPSALKTLLPSSEVAPLDRDAPSEFGKKPAATGDAQAPELNKKHLIPRPSAALPNAKPLNLLFIDDSQSVRFAYKQMLLGQGFEVNVAASIAEG